MNFSNIYGKIIHNDKSFKEEVFTYQPLLPYYSSFTNMF
jgi:hypothetical protein